MDRYKDAESEDSVPDVLTRDLLNEFDNGDLLHYRNDAKRYAVNWNEQANQWIDELGPIFDRKDIR